MSAVLRLEERLSEVEAEVSRAVSENPGLASRMACFTRIRGIGKAAASSSACEAYGFECFGNGAAFAEQGEGGRRTRARRTDISDRGAAWASRDAPGGETRLDIGASMMQAAADGAGTIRD